MNKHEEDKLLDAIETVLSLFFQHGRTPHAEVWDDDMGSYKTLELEDEYADAIKHLRKTYSDI